MQANITKLLCMSDTKLSYEVKIIFIFLISDMKDVTDNSNPWNSASIYDFLYYICPECPLKVHEKQDFINHAYEMHQNNSMPYFNTVWNLIVLW